MKSLIALMGLVLGLIGCSSVSESQRLVGKPAPNFKLALLDGGETALADHLGKHIVILDFWATWCGPCRAAMPVIHEVASEYSSKGVVLYAVNEDESKNEIRQFLTDKGLSVNVALDPGARTGMRYGAESIPQTVIIDTKGIVRAVHVGAIADLKERLRADLDSVIKGSTSAQ